MTPADETESNPDKVDGLHFLLALAERRLQRAEAREQALAAEVQACRQRHSTWKHFTADDGSPAMTEREMVVAFIPADEIRRVAREEVHKLLEARTLEADARELRGDLP